MKLIYYRIYFFVSFFFFLKNEKTKQSSRDTVGDKYRIFCRVSPWLHDTGENKFNLQLYLNAVNGRKVRTGEGGVQKGRYL